MQKSILQLEAGKARDFFLQEESYCNFDLPPYIQFSNLLNAINNKIETKDYKLEQICSNLKKPEECENVNYKLFNNKNAKYDWRPFELIHPALYIFLVREITQDESWDYIKNKFKEYSENSYVQCFSIPVISKTNKSNKAEQVLRWWNRIEQDSIKYSLEFDYLFHTDITNFYPSIYTHSIAWALHTKETAKEKKNDKSLLGNKIDEYIRKMSYGQTNGIPQGSVLMDFIAEIILAYVDNLLKYKIKSEKINRKNFKIIRYRDDYRIFTNNPQNTEIILKNLSQILADIGLKLNPSKTIASQNIIQGSIKKDKFKWLFVEPILKEQNTLQKQLLALHQFSLECENSGALIKSLEHLLKDLNYKTTKTKQDNKRDKYFFKVRLGNENKEVLIAILIDIAVLNPRTYPFIMAILGILFSETKNKSFINKSMQKLQRIYNNSYMQIWLQRAIIKQKHIEYKNFDEIICKKVIDVFTGQKDKVLLWNNDWLASKEVKSLFKKYPIILKENIDKLPPNIENKEINLFDYQLKEQGNIMKT